jgi:transposase
MQVIYERCAGIDIHKKMIVVTVLITLVNGQVQKYTRTFSTMTADLLAVLATWHIRSQNCQLRLLLLIYLPGT